ncbi:MAG: RraA family protein [Oscillospiraceae bacterium]|jgi:regulator of RNase E activity RraA|nr:RraA family protein [Oscillospiraceae bacterium]
MSYFNNKDQTEFLTPEWTGERLSDGRPMVSQSLLERLRRLTLEEAWGTIYSKGYKYQFQGDFMRTNPDPNYRLVGRAVTATLVPTRPDLHALTTKQGIEAEGRRGTFNQWVIDSLVEDDVVVVDFYDKVRDGTFVGGNLSTAISTRTKRGGAVLWGGIRDMEQIVKIKGLQVMHRGEDPTPIAEYVITGMNTPCRIGGATCMPGDVVFATQSGVLFIPPQLAEEAVVKAEKAHVRDIFGFTRLREGVYSTAQVDTGWTRLMMDDFVQWIQDAIEGEPYQHLTWEEELEAASKIEPKK